MQPHPGSVTRSRAPQKPRSSRFRPDIEGLRAVAVLGVVLYHAHVGVLRGGFVGVDIFFVVSGYLITGLLWRELERDHRVSLAAFYGRRARRLLPMSILVIVVTALASRRWLPPLQLPSVMRDGAASALYVGNYRFALNQTNYLNATAPPSPYQHFWSLGVEEQFYLVWPLLLIAAAMIWRTRGAKQVREASRGNAIAALTAVTLGSFLLSVWLTSVNQPWAFFSLPTRAWELGLGGVLALASPMVARLPVRSAVLAGWAGLAVAVGSMFVISSHDPFPGLVAAVPVLGTVAVLAAGEVSVRPGTGVVLDRRPMRFMGRISYSWYLWHWPFLIIAPYVVGHALGLGSNLLVAAMSGVVATATFLLIETPARSSRWLGSVPRRSLLTGASLSAAGALACAVIATSAPSLAGRGVARVAVIRDPVSHSARPARPALARSGGVTTTTLDPLQARIDSINHQIEDLVASSVGIEQVPSNLVPSLAGAGTDDPPVFVDGCMDSYVDSSVRPCQFGDVGSPTKVVLFGDSHAAMWFPAVDYAADQNGWELLNLTKATCPPILIPIISPVLGREFTECETWRENVLQRIREEKPALVILGVTRHYTSIYGFTPYQQPWLQGLSEMVSQIRALGAQVLVIGPVPKPRRVIPDCLSQHLVNAAVCTVSVAQGINETGMAAERAAVVAAGGTYLDVQPWFCTATTCAVIVGNIEVWRDDNHIDATYAQFLGPAMSAELAAAVHRS